ncbi:hypothetical protein BRC86_11770 [Halobacteriales archaeon QS_3_64_16]|nr:MAG: hypothetical protein BRC86_11770 [Halobacteriales archaeon QS_3_64_16]
MSVRTSGVYRVLRSPRDQEELLLLDVSSTDPTYVPSEGYEEPFQERVDGLEPGNRIEATVEWDPEGSPRLGEFEVLTRTYIEFIDGATGIFEAAHETAEEAAMEGEAMNSRVTKSTDNEDNGVVYTFAKQTGERDLYEEFEEGITPLEPLIARLGEGGADPPYDVFVIRPAEESFVIVYLALEREGLLARTVRDTYG